jgi:2-polyprenyl-3-methyl-5-hydroxy-6-metoxy-1,4-benzoquinol methylase
MMELQEELNLDFPRCLEADFPEDLPGARAAFESIAGAIAGGDFSSLSRRSPGLQAFDWHSYLRCSIARMVHAAAALRRRGLTSGRLLDYGSYFGNFALMFAGAGFAVDAADKYGAYEHAFDGTRRVLAESGVRLLDFDEVGYDLATLEAHYDVVLCMGVIEHIPSSPRPLLETLNRVLTGGGVLVIDTPNLVHLYNRQKFARGETVLADIESQYETELPFEGHHREYTIPELVWMLRRLGHHRISIEAFNYSSYALGTLSSRDVYNHWNMVRDPTMREYLMTVSAKPAAPSAAEPDERDWRELIEDPEQSWLRSLPAAMMDQPIDAGVGHELQLVRLQKNYDTVQHEVNVRDEMIRDLHERFVREVQRRDEIIDGLRREQDWMRSGWRRFVIRRPAQPS